MSKKPPVIKETRNWYKDRYQSVLLQRRLLMGLTVLSMLSTLATVLVIAKLTPLKSVEPFVIQVDSRSGITQVVNPITVREITANESVNNFFIVQYIRARESYNMRDIARNYPIVRVMSASDTIYPRFLQEATPGNPKSPAARLGATGTRSVRFKSISYVKPFVAQARLLIEESTANGGVVQMHRIATVTFEYAKLALTTEERYINPLGFRVTEYRLDEDALPK
jgi:type IV secretion system protein VirB8